MDGASTFAVKIASVHEAGLEWGASTPPRDSEPFRPLVQAQSSERHDLIKRLLSGTASGPSKQPQAIALPPDPQLRADLCAPTWKLGARGFCSKAKTEAAGSEISEGACHRATEANVYKSGTQLGQRLGYEVKYPFAEGDEKILSIPADVLKW